MKIVLDEKNREWILEFSNEKDLQRFFDAVERNGSFDIPADGIPQNATFRARAAGSPRSRKLRPLSIVREGRVAKIQMFRSPSSAQQDADQKDASAFDPNALIGAEEPERKTVTTLDDIKSLPLSEKIYLARRADLHERRVLMRENHPKIQEFLLRNARITEPEIAWMAGNPVSPMQTILAICQHREWMSKDSVRIAILCNPRTPVHFVLEKIPHLSGADLRRMSHSQHLRNDVLNAVKQEMKKKGIPVKSPMD